MKELSSRVSKNGNADRESAFEMYKEGSDTRRGLIVVLKADVRNSEVPSADRLIVCVLVKLISSPISHFCLMVDVPIHMDHLMLPFRSCFM